MKLRMIGIAAAVVTVFGMTGCEDYFAKQDAKPDGSTPYMNVSSPNKNFIYENNQMVAIKTVVSDKDKIKDLNVSVVEISTGQEVFGYNLKPTKNPVVIDTAFSTNGMNAGEYTFKIHAVDNRTNQAHQEINFNIGGQK